MKISKKGVSFTASARDSEATIRRSDGLILFFNCERKRKISRERKFVNEAGFSAEKYSMMWGFSKLPTIERENLVFDIQLEGN